MKTISLFFVSGLILFSCSPEKQLLHKAEIATDRMQYDDAINYYDQVLAKNKNSFEANAGKGIVLSEFTERYDKAIPYLENALRESTKDTMMNLTYNLGKSYHYIGNYDRAIYYYSKLKNYTQLDDPNFEFDLAKRIQDCRYALAHPETAPPEEVSLTSLGVPINSDMPEYGAVTVGDKFIFTSKKKDSPHEKKNAWDGKYFESMYISTIDHGAFTKPKRYTVPDHGGDSKFSKYNEAVISASPDGKKLFIYRDARIYEADVNDSASNPNKMDRNVNFARFQNHAYVTKGGDRLFFTSESKKGKGGTDIYTAVKTNGEWSPPELLDSTINTAFDEDAPYYSEDGTLYFSSNGLPGYGGYDVYKTHLVNGHWTVPENLGQPINSPGDDIFFMLEGNTADGYYSSNRPGGYGDMDIYKVHYFPGEEGCQTPSDDMLAINAIPVAGDNMKYQFELIDQQHHSVKSYSWKINGALLNQNTNKFQYTFSNPGDYTVSVKIIINCDTCRKLLAECTQRKIIVNNELLVQNDSSSSSADRNEPNQTLPLNIELASVYFDYNMAVLRPDAISVLNKDIALLKKNTTLQFTISGYADSRGADAYNKQLSLRRANTVRNYLLRNGIAQERIKGVYALGETMLVNGCDDNVPCSEEQHQQNRRVEFKLMNGRNSLAISLDQ